MADDKKTPMTIDEMEALSDEDFLKLEEPEPIEGPEDKEKDDATTGNADTDAAAADAAAAASGGGDTSTGADTGDGEDGSTSGGADDAGDGEDGKGTGGAGETEKLTEEEQLALETKEEAAKVEADAAAEAAKTKGVNDDKETLKLKDETAEQKTTRETKEAAAQVVEAQTEATSFFDKVSAPFKADGKEIQIRTPEEAIRLMQMGVNYSRRMEEMKPLRAMDAMLTAHGLNDPDKLNELIDLSKGSVEAIQKYLKKHDIDPLDLDVSKGDAHTTPNYRADPKDIAFQDAIDTTLLANGGKELLGDVNRDWDEQSKEALRENPSIFGKLLEQRDTGVYEQINKELLHQRTMGYLAGVPFLQAYEQVGNAMQKAGVFDKEVQKTGLAPIDSGRRKAALKKTEQPNPNLSSSNQNRNAAPKAVPEETDYLSMSDEDFMKLEIPA